MVAVWFGGEQLETDDSTRLGFQYKSGFCENDGGGEKSRTFDFSVPETPTNNRIFVYSEDPAYDGVRRSARGVIIDGGVWLTGRMYLTEWNGGRYSLLFIFDNTPDFANITAQGGLFSDYLESGKEEMVVGGTIPNFGFYNYVNGVNSGSGMVPSPLTMYPTSNLGYLIDTMAAAAGYTVSYPAGSGMDAHDYGLVLDSMSSYEEHEVAVSGTALGGFTTTVDGGSGTMTDAGLVQLSGRQMKRGWPVAHREFVRTFQALRALKIKLTQDIGDYAYVTNDGYDCYNGEGHPKPTPIGNGRLFAYGTEFELNAGDYFTIVNIYTDARQGDRFWWWGPLQPNPGYTGSVTTKFTTLTDDGVAQYGANINLADNLPVDLTLKKLLQAYCDIIAGYYDIDEANGVITVGTFPNMINSASVGVDLDTMRVTNVGAVRRYIDGWAQHNLVRCKSADYVTDECRFKRDYQCSNDWLEDEQEWAEIPFNDGNWEMRDVSGQYYKVAVLEDVQIGSNGDYNYKGTLSIIREAPAGVPALHIQTTTDDGIGNEFGEFTANTLTLEVTARMPLYRYLKIKKGMLARWIGNTYLIKEAAWDDGYCKLTLLRLV